MKSKLFVLLICACLALSGALAEGEAPALLEPAGVELDYAAATVMDLYTVTPYAASVVPHTEDLSFTVDGVVAKVHVHLGSSVRAGDALITLDEEDLLEQEAELAEELDYTRRLHANANELAQIDIRIQTLEMEQMKKAGASEAELIRAETDVEMLRLKLRQTQQEQAVAVSALEEELAGLRGKIGKNVLCAPYDGVIVSIANLREDYGVTAYDTVIRIADESRLHLSGEFVTQNTVKSAHEVYALINGQKYALEYLPADMSEHLSAVFAGVPLRSEFNIEGDLTELACGDYAAVCVVTGYVEDALSIPCNALYSDSAGRYVYKLDEDGQRVRVNVHTGMSNSLYIQITDGLEEGDLVYVKE
ncbi:MAG: efflux RND transporter periplasmic adaptor subunit [Eubacteriales bacterium]|nr:efflux RND transporter periplasmic adaptor subunit [Eubacteriales bacterium]